ncbi:MAG: iron-containing alcohol dehydrogenase [Gammaproteobacteria bacterium]|nr:iron-containing alcohol dehydrogenase [Gammaproteobacteria bacterium]MCP5443323.1 iron-containing alcohol dehydrogenase [Chromatiaceae bacterium]
MNSFIFNSVKSLVCEPGALARLGEFCQKLSIKHIMLVTDQGILKAGLLLPALEALAANDIQVTLYDQVEADPAEAIVNAAVRQAIEAGIDGVIGMGGGSSMDVAKLVALLAKGDETLDEIYGINLVKGGRLPLIQIPTTAGTGSEVTPISIITIGEGEKKGVVAPQLLPDLALLDADLTRGLPAPITAATGVDAMVHAIEAYTSANANSNPVSSMLAKQALSLLGGNIETAVKSGQDLNARSAMLLGSMLAGAAFANSPVAAVHALAYPLGGTYHIPHGLSNALVLPHVMRFNLPACGEDYAELAPWAFLELANEIDSGKRAQAFIERLAELNHGLGLQTRLREMGIEKDALSDLARDAMKQTRLLVNNPREVTETDALAIYHAAW